MIIHGAFVIYQTFFSADACLLEVKVFLCMLLKYFATSLTQVFREKTVKMSSFKSHLIYLGLILHVPVYLRFLPLVNVMLLMQNRSLLLHMH